MSEIDPRTPPLAAPPLPHVDAKVHAIDCDFLLSYLEPFGHFIEQPEDADLLLAMNSVAPGAIQALAEARRWRKPLAWWTIEDPNAFEAFLPQAQLADFVFRTGRTCDAQSLVDYGDTTGGHQVGTGRP